MTFPQQVAAVIDDTRESYPDMSGAAALEHVWRTISPNALDESDSELADAYRLVISHLRAADEDGAVTEEAEALAAEASRA